MKILSIESSCDDTGVAILNSSEKEHQISANIVSSQIKTHQPYGGVVPNLAAREHLKNILPCLKQAFFESKKKPTDIDLIAVTNGPGLIPSLLVGVNFAKALSYRLQKPLIGINHMEGHIYANWLPRLNQDSEIENTQPKLPAICLIVSGGHTQIVLIEDRNQYKLLGETRDDAAGEAFDKVAHLLGLEYPGGPAISKIAKEGNPEAFKFPRPMIFSDDYDFSFSGLKTAVLYERRKEKEISKEYRADMAASFQKAVVDVLVAKTIKAAQKHNIQNIMLAGGVAANPLLRQSLSQAVEHEFKTKLLIPDLTYCTDNAAMIGAAAFYKEIPAQDNWQNINANSNLKMF